MSFNVDGLNYCELAHRIVRETACSYCNSRPGQRCRTFPKDDDTVVFGGTVRIGKVLSPSRSHRARLNAYWAKEKAA